MKLVEFSIRRPVTMIILVAVLLILGSFTLSRLSLDLYPEMKFPVAAVITSYAGAGPEEVESQVTKPLESMISNISNIKEVDSTSAEGSSIIIVQFNWGTDMDSAALDISEKVNFIEAMLPEAATKPMVFKMDPNMMPVIQVGISGGADLAQLQSIAEDVIEPRLARIPEIASVVITGGVTREVQVDVDPVKLENAGLTLAQVTQVLQMENFNMAGGKVAQGGREMFVRNLQQFESMEQICQVSIQSTDGRTVRLGEIAAIVDGNQEITQITRVNGQSAVGVHCLKQSDANTVKACEAVKKELEKIQQELNMDLDIAVVFDQSQYIQESIHSTVKMILEGSLLAMVVLFLFLRKARSTLIVFTSIPLSIIATFIVMYFSGYTINLITMGGLALGLGRIVDDSIVVFENIYRHRALGLSSYEAARKGASQVGNAVIATTLAIIAVFLPMAFVEGIAAILFKPLAMTVCFAIFCSLMVALTIIPLLSSRLLTNSVMAAEPDPGKRLSRLLLRVGSWLDGLGERYKVLLGKTLKRRRLVVIGVTVMMVLSLAAIPLVGAEFLPSMDSGEISVTIQTDKGSKLAGTDEITRRVEDKLHEFPEVKTVFSSIGSSSVMLMGSGSATDTSTLYVQLIPKGERQDVKTIAEKIRTSLQDIAGAKIEVSAMDATMQMGSGSSAINVQVRGNDLEVLKQLSTEIATIIRQVPGTREVVSSLTEGKPELRVRVDRDRAAAFGLTPMQISNEISTAMQGKVATQYKVEGQEVDVRVCYTPQTEKDLDYLTNLSIRNNQGMVVKLSSVASFQIMQGPIEISRIDQVRSANINADLLNRDLNSVMQDIKTQVNQLNLPAGYSVEYAGTDQEMMETFYNLFLALILAIILCYSVMAILYESFFDPFVIMFSVPTAFIGVVLSLLLTGSHFSVSAFIGVIMLVGIVVANAIVFVDYLKQMREEGMERNEAIMETGRVRLRPILMTALATILAMLPLALGLGEGGESLSPLGIVVIGGLLVSTLVTLLLVPVVYTIFDDWLEAFRNKKASSPKRSLTPPA
ncbi:MAG: efflux RND transporter permease subunit [Syntrophomonadaceae bacterium]